MPLAPAEIYIFILFVVSNERKRGRKYKVAANLNSRRNSKTDKPNIFCTFRCRIIRRPSSRWSPFDDSTPEKLFAKQKMGSEIWWPRRRRNSLSIVSRNCCQIFIVIFLACSRPLSTCKTEWPFSLSSALLIQHIQFILLFWDILTRALSVSRMFNALI